MIPSATFYLAGSFAALVFLTIMILKIGALMADCPDGGPAARTAALTVTTGFAAIGAGGILLIGAALPMLAELSVPTVLAALGFATLCLGLGFTQAIATLRDVLSPRPLPTIERPAPTPTSTPTSGAPSTAAMPTALG